MSYGLVWVDLQGDTLLDEELPILQHRNTGGVLLFARNFVHKEQLKNLVASIRANANKPILIGVDHEGGRIWRFQEGFTCPPAANKFGSLYVQNPELAKQQLILAGNTIAYELMSCGIDLNFSPVLDLDHHVSAVIGDRAYHSDPNIVSACARAFIAGLEQYGMAAIGKHFPGHGACAMDSHFSVAIDDRDFTDIKNKDLVPFTQLHDVLAGVMPAHVIYPRVDAKAAGFSKYWLEEILRKEIGFAGAIISDCLSMQGSGVVDNMAQGAKQALIAGCDMVITTQQTREHLLHVLDSIDWTMSTEQQKRISGLAANFSNQNLQSKPGEMQEFLGLENVVLVTG